MKNTFILFVFIFSSLSYVGAQKQPINVTLANEKSFSLIVYPDPQNYAKYDVYQPIFEMMTAWPVNNIERLNVKAVLCAGDLVDENGMAEAGFRLGNVCI